MGATVGAVTVDMSANSAAFVRDMGKSRQALASNSAVMNKALGKMDRGWNNLRLSLKRTSKGMISMRSIVATVAGAGGIGLLIKSSLDVADSIGKTADAIGISRAALQEYRFALGIAGASQDQVDKGLKRFVRNMGDLARSSSETQTALKDLDPALLQNLRSLDTVEQQLQESFRAVGNYTKQTKVAAVGQAVFGKSASEMTLAVKDGSAALEGLRQRARTLGLVMSDELIDNAARAKDEMSILAQVIKIKATTAVVAFAPQIADLAQAFTDGIPKIIDWVEALGKFVGLIDKSQSERVKDIAGEINKLNAEISSLNAEIAETRGNVVADFFKAGVIKSAEEDVAALEKRVVSLKAKLGVAINAADFGTLPPPPKPGAPSSDLPKLPTLRRGPAAGSFRAGQDEDLVRGIQAARDVVRGFEADQRAAAAVIAMTTVEMNRQAGQTAVLITAAEQGTAAFQAQTEIFDLQNAALMQGIDLTTEQGMAWEAAFRSNQIFANGLEETRTRMETARAETERMADTITGVLDAAISGNIQSWKDMGRVAVGVIQEILREQLRAAVAAKAAGGFGGGGIVGSILSGIGGLFGGGGDLVGSFPVGQAFPPSFAHGGTATVGGAGGTDSKLAVLRVSPREDITVRTPAQQKAGHGGGRDQVNITQNFDFRGAEPGVFARAQQFKEQIKAETVATVFGLINDGGSEARMSGRRRGRR